MREVKIKALRGRVWFKLPLENRSIIDLTLKSVRKIRSRVLTNVLMNIIFKIIRMISDKTVEIYRYGFIIAKNTFHTPTIGVIVKLGSRSLRNTCC